MKRGEEAEFSVIAESFNNLEEEDSFKDEEIIKSIKDYDPKRNLYFNVQLHSLVKVEDWYKDGTTLMRTLRSGGKGRSPYADSTIKCKYVAEIKHFCSKNES